MLSFINRADEGGMMDRVIAAQVYLRICELGSLSGAGAGDVASDGRYLEQMENRLAPGWIHRPHPPADPTPAGKKVLLKTRGLTRIADEIAGERQRADPSGTLRVACAHFTVMQLISPLLPDFLARYPQLRLELDIVANHPVSLIGERIDVAIRITDNPEPGAIACRLGLSFAPLPHRACSSSMARWRHLTNCNSITVCYTANFAGQRWQFSDAQGQEASVAVSGNLSADLFCCWRRRSPGAALRCSSNWRRGARWPAGRWRWCSRTGRRRR